VTGASSDERKLAAATLASLPCITPARLRRLLEQSRDPEEALAYVRAGRGAEVIAGNRTDAYALASVWARNADPARTRARMFRRRTHVWIDGDPDYPIRDSIPGRPAVLLGEGGDADAFDAPRVAMVGTRSASPHGLADAREIAAHVAAAGVTVVSGLAIGIDGASHQGALDASGRAVGVVATGLDVVYPRRHGQLFERVRTNGVIVTEHAYGVQPNRMRFPVRNRIIAALCDVCVVVEATAGGGAAITASFANDYGRPVYALPGARRNEAAAGCNALIADGATPLLDPGDILIGLGRGRAGSNWQPPLPLPDDPDESRVLGVLVAEPASVDQLATRTGLSLERLAGALRRLEHAGRIERNRGRWWSR
jgi:DNA processing protein